MSAAHMSIAVQANHLTLPAHMRYPRIEKRPKGQAGEYVSNVPLPFFVQICREVVVWMKKEVVMVRKSAVLLLLACASCSDLDFEGGGRKKRTVEVDPLYMVGIFDGTYKASAVKHLTDSNGRDEVSHYDDFLSLFDQNGPSLTVMKTLNALPDRDSYEFRGNTFDLESGWDFSYYSHVDYLGKGDREGFHVHLWGSHIDGAGVVFRTWEVDFDVNLGDAFPGFEGQSFSGESPKPFAREMLMWEPEKTDPEEEIQD